MRLKTRIGLASLAMGAVFVACQMKTIPLSAQAGSTIAIALDTAETMGRIGYAGDYSPDPQRGRILLKLLQPGSPACSENPCRYLVARMANVAVGSEATEVARNGPPNVAGIQPHSARMAILLFDIPADTKPGKFDIKAFREVPNPNPSAPPSLVELSHDPDRTLTILPNAIEPTGVAGQWRECGPQASPVTTCGVGAVVGTPTPDDYWRKWSGKSAPDDWWWQDGSAYVDKSFPSPELIFSVTGSGGNVWALEFTVPYDSSQIEVLDVVAPIDTTTPTNDRPAVFFEDDGVEIKVKVVGLFQKITRVAFVFDLEVDPDPNFNPQFTRLDWTDFQTGGTNEPFGITAYDQNGELLGATVSAIGVL